MVNHKNITSQKIRVLLLDHHTLVREGLRLLLENQTHLEIIGESGSREEAIELTKEMKPDIILLDLNLDGDDDTGIIAELLAISKKSQIILTTGSDNQQQHRQAVQLGVMGVISKTESCRILMKAIKKVYDGEAWIDRTMMADVLNRLQRARSSVEDPEQLKIAELSDREREVITLIGQGMKNKQIAEHLTISEVTVRHHLTSIYSKLGVNDRLELIIYAYRNELAQLPV